MTHRGLLTFLVATIAYVAGCGRADMVATQVAPNSLKDVLSLSARSLLTSDGQLRIVSEVGGGEINETQARKLAEAFLRTHMAGLKGSLEEDRGGEINIESLKLCGRAFYATSPLASPPETIPVPYRRAVGSWWIVNFCGLSGTAEVSLAISALATDLEIADGRLRYPSFSGNEFQPMGVNADAQDGFPGTPENAVLMAARATGLAITDVPELIWIYGKYPQLSQWRVKLARPTTADGDAIVPRAEVYVGYDTGLRKWVLRVAAPAQRPAIELAWHQPINGKMSTRMVTTVPRRAGRTIDFVPMERQ